MFKYDYKDNSPRNNGYFPDEVYVFRFPNDYGASVIRREHSYGGLQGLFELAVLSFDENGNCRLNYNTHITNDVIGYLTESDVNDLLDQIQELEVE